eukprot:gi/632949190/ref/XP_007890007.1/ PREDICTED: DNA repair protein complementing XP-G cells [Callorhinchus milii]
MKPLEMHNPKIIDSSPYAVLEEIKQRKVLDLRRWYCISRPQYKTSCGISSLTSCWNYLFSTCGTGSLPPITQEEALHILGFQEPYEDIKFGPFTGNATLMRWFRQLNDHFHMKGCCYVLYKPNGKNRTVGETAEGALMKLTQGLKDESMTFVYHCQNHYFCPIGFEATPLKAKKAYQGKLHFDEMEFWILIGEPSKKHPAIHCKKWTDIVTDLNTQNPQYLDIRNTDKGIQSRKTLKVGGNLHCIMAFQRLNWQRLNTWMMNIGNFRYESSKRSRCKANTSKSDLASNLSDHDEPTVDSRSSGDGFPQVSEWNPISHPYEYRDGVSPESETDDESIGRVNFSFAMGVQGLWKLLECTRQPINPETLEGKILAVDISIWLNQAVKGARDRHGNAIHNAHLLTLFHRLCKLLFHRIRPIFVFDGKAPLLKKQTLANRRQRKELATRESKKTTDKLLKTILKRQALKNALGSKSEEIVPSLSQVRKEEIDDIYVLPPLEKKEENSSDEEAEKEWEERVNNRKLLQNEFLENPHSIDIESEDFASLPPEMRHEILSDLKEFTKRQRTLIYSMPEESTDFSQYQLTGLLKRNKLNQHIEGIQKEMNEQYSGQIQLQYNKEGGFVKDVETRRLVSEDSTHYILLKGLKSKNTENEEPGLQTATNLQKTNSSTSTSVGPHSDQKPCVASRPPSSPTDRAAKATTSDNDGSVAAAAPPSPRTLIAIQAAMLESSSDEETESTENKLLFRNQDWPQHSTNVAATNMNVSPRTYRAIQDALEDDEITTETGWDSLNKCNSSRKRPALSSSSEDDSENKLLKTSVNAQNSSSEQTISQTVGLKDQSCVEPKEGSITSSQNTLTKVENQSASSVASNAVDTVKIEQNIQELDFQSLEVIKKPEDPDLINSTDGQTSFSNGEYIHLREKVLSSESKNANNAASPKPPFPITPVPTQAVIFLKPEIQDLNNSVPIADQKQGSVEEALDRGKMQINIGSESDSDDSFIEVDDTSKVGSSSDVFPSDTFTTSSCESESKPAPTGGTQSSETIEKDTEELSQILTLSPLEVEEPVPQEMIEETEENAWDDIDLEEIEALEDNLFVEQSNLQTQKRRQEQMAATVTGQMYLESQELLRLFGVPYIVAPMEAEAQCAFLDMTDQTNGTITDDSDVWLFGARHVYKNFFSQDKYVEYYQYVHIHNQLGLDRTKLINLAYLLGSDYTEGIATVGYVTGMELLNEFLGPGQQPLIQLRDWWNEAQNNKRLQSNPNDTKVKKKLRELKISPGFPNAAVAEAYLKPSVDESKELLSWGKPDLDQIRDFCKNYFSWNKTKIDDILLPIIKKLNVHQTQQRIDTFFRVERHEQQAIKSQRLRRAVTCILRKDREETLAEVQEATAAMGEATKCTGQKRGGEQAMAIQERASGSQSQTRKRQKPQKSPQGLCSGGFIGSASLAEAPPSEDEVEVEATNSKRLGLNARSLEKQMKGRENKNDNTAVDMSSSSGDEEDEGAAKMITARSVFGKRGKLKGARGNPRKKR